MAYTDFYSVVVAVAIPKNKTFTGEDLLQILTPHIDKTFTHLTVAKIGRTLRATFDWRTSSWQDTDKMEREVGKAIGSAIGDVDEYDEPTHNILFRPYKPEPREGRG